MIPVQTTLQHPSRYVDFALPSSKTDPHLGFDHQDDIFVSSRTGTEVLRSIIVPYAV